MLSVRNADITDLEPIMEIYHYAQDYMIQSGNPTQWGHFYPDEEMIKADIRLDVCRVIFFALESFFLLPDKGQDILLFLFTFGIRPSLQ